MIGVGKGERVGGKWELVGVGKEKVGGEWRMVGVGGERESGREVKTGGGGVEKERVRGSENGRRERKRERERGGEGDEKLVGVEVGKESRGEWKMVGVERRKREWMGKNGEWQHTAKLILYSFYWNLLPLTNSPQRWGTARVTNHFLFLYKSRMCIVWHPFDEILLKISYLNWSPVQIKLLI